MSKDGVALKPRLSDEAMEKFNAVNQELARIDSGMAARFRAVFIFGIREIWEQGLVEGWCLGEGQARIAPFDGHIEEAEAWVDDWSRRWNTGEFDESIIKALKEDSF
ncbi:MAG: hypothetical protein GX256_03335 [Fretibacterium sp.]|nr:hypothetical protein [Fretibacterium sp.]